MSKPDTVGLVLAGGGFKGAYQIGAWKALRELGVTRFDVIAGTSAGALNAALVAADDPAAAERVWIEKDVVGFAPAGLVWYALAYMFLFGPIVVPIILIGGSFGFWWWSGTNPEMVVWLSASLAMSGLMVMTLIRLESLHRRVFFTIDANTFVIGALLLFAAVLTAVAGITQEARTLSPCRADAPVALCVVSLVGFVACIPFGFASGLLGIRALRKARTSQVFANEGMIAELTVALGDLSAIRRRVRSVFITTAHGRSIVDPFRPNLKIESQGGEARQAINLDAPGFHDAWASEYFDLCTAASPAAAVEHLRLSGAFPIAFKGGTTAANETIADGGLVDNVPLLPVVQAGAESIIVILLSPPREFFETLEMTLIDRWIDHSIPGLPWEGAKALYTPWVRRVFSDRDEPVDRAATPGLDQWLPNRPVLRGKRITLIAPARPLAQLAWLPLLTGTLNPSRAFRRRCFTQGYEDTLKTFGSLIFEY